MSKRSRTDLDNPDPKPKPKTRSGTHAKIRSASLMSAVATAVRQRSDTQDPSLISYTLLSCSNQITYFMFCLYTEYLEFENLAPLMYVCKGFNEMTTRLDHFFAEICVKHHIIPYIDNRAPYRWIVRHFEHSATVWLCGCYRSLVSIGVACNECIHDALTSHMFNVATTPQFVTECTDVEMKATITDLTRPLSSYLIEQCAWGVRLYTTLVPVGSFFIRRLEKNVLTTSEVKQMLADVFRYPLTMMQHNETTDLVVISTDLGRDVVISWDFDGQETDAAVAMESCLPIDTPPVCYAQKTLSGLFSIFISTLVLPLRSFTHIVQYANAHAVEKTAGTPLYASVLQQMRETGDVDELCLLFNHIHISVEPDDSIPWYTQEKYNCQRVDLKRALAPVVARITSAFNENGGRVLELLSRRAHDSDDEYVYRGVAFFQESLSRIPLVMVIDVLLRNRAGLQCGVYESIVL
jgi:hypothetical protein